MMSYKITDDEINWKHEPNTDTTVTNVTASVSVEEKLWSRYDWSVESKTGAALRYNISNALKQSHSKYSKMKRLSEAQQEENIRNPVSATRNHNYCTADISVWPVTISVYLTNFFLVITIR